MATEKQAVPKDIAALSFEDALKELEGIVQQLELHLAALELLDDRFQLLQRVLERQGGDILGHGGFFGQFCLSGGRGGW